MPNSNVIKKRAQVAKATKAPVKKVAAKPSAVPAPKASGKAEFHVGTYTANNVDVVNGCTFADINQFVKDNAGGSMANVQVVALATPSEVPFGWGGKKPATGLGVGRVAKQTGGVRATCKCFEVILCVNKFVFNRVKRWFIAGRGCYNQSC